VRARGRAGRPSRTAGSGGAWGGGGGRASEPSVVSERGRSEWVASLSLPPPILCPLLFFLPGPRRLGAGPAGFQGADGGGGVLCVWESGMRESACVRGRGAAAVVERRRDRPQGAGQPGSLPLHIMPSCRQPSAPPCTGRVGRVSTKLTRRRPVRAAEWPLTAAYAVAILFCYLVVPSLLSNVRGKVGHPRGV